jgi:beta-lactamase regulating signal transducer with metallopeptidase domain
MIHAFALLLGVGIVAGYSPGVLNRMMARRIDPQVVLVTWVALVATSFLTVIAALVVVVLPTHGPMSLVVQLVHHCWTSVQHGALPQLHAVTALLLLIGVTSLLLLVSVRLMRHVRRQRSVHRRQLELLRVAAQPEAGRFPTMWLPHSKPLAYSVAGTPPFVVATNGVRDELCARGTAAVIEHERAHLQGRHHMLVGLAEALASSAPWLPLLRHSPALVRTAVELAADRSAALLHGADSVRSALLVMSDAHDGPAPSYALGMADNAVALRLHHLECLKSKPTRAKRAVASGLAGLTAALLPALAGMGVLASIAMIVCPILFEM